MDIKTIALLGGGIEQVVAVKIAKELGYRTLVVDDNPNAHAKPYADEFLCTTIKDLSKLISDIKPYQISGILTHAAELSIETAIVAKELGLPGISVNSAELGTLKHRRIEKLKESGVNIPGFSILDYNDTLEKWYVAAKHIGYPLVAKPTSYKGAMGVVLITNEHDLVNYYNSARLEYNSECYLLEKFLEGKQFSTESIYMNGMALRHNFAYRHYEGMERFHPFLIEDGHSMPVNISKNQKNDIIKAIDLSAGALYVQNGVIKGDVLVDKNGKVYIIEMATRSSGGRFADFVTVKQCGVQILYSMIQMAMGDPVDLYSLEEKWDYGVSQRFIFLNEGVRVKCIKNLDIIRSMKGVEDIVISDTFLKNRIQNRICSHRDRIGYVICRDKNVTRADNLAKKICKLIIQNMEIVK